MKVEIWADFACPFCYIGKHRFEKALAQFEYHDQTEVIYRSFELDPNSPKHVPYDVYDMLSTRYNISREQAIASNKNLSQHAATEGLDFQFDSMVLTNTFDAHRLRHLAEKYSKSTIVSELLFHAYFSESKNLSDSSTLADIAAEAGMDRVEALSVLEGKQFADQVRAEEKEGSRLGIQGVPYYVINRKLVLSGAQPENIYLNALQQAWDDE